jgi:hypothetical protein
MQLEIHSKIGIYDARYNYNGGGEVKILIQTNTLFPIFVQPFTHTGNKNSVKTKNE